ncbi:PQQ-like beta-propeller repeat protein [Haloarcula sp. S1CR25-12]|uniref:PQQ-like beta-propeller repeat protein n=1 Tax=Haloarcula saliterrae TaxID=2950534 RepID=A0ABU2FDW2_9EURY|nr:PQQ-binding-like beta-propeller repeat protein [Haloarcula sp. S1CR25-12]MDS0260020.1 PQQ-like beta-propeller repeat protein [Haloarcula sp. S1CR25-12]
MYWVQWVTYCVPSAADLDSGSQSWTSDANAERTEPSTTGTDDAVFVYPQWLADAFCALDAETGDVRWTQEGVGSTTFPPVVLDLVVAITDGLGAEAREPTTGEQLGRAIPSSTGTDRTVVTYDTRAVAYRL